TIHRLRKRKNAEADEESDCSTTSHVEDVSTRPQALRKIASPVPGPTIQHPILSVVNAHIHDDRGKDIKKTLPGQERREDNMF
ncbi:MAG: hypothetical protein J6S75_09845, partial [Thermoguttaceae bacterium]|nr:hypothetical protein [Thermoguttaceae bacterium]